MVGEDDVTFARNTTNMEMGLPVKKMNKSFGGGAKSGGSEGARGAGGAQYVQGGTDDARARAVLAAVDGLAMPVMQKLWLAKEIKARAGDAASLQQFLVEKALPVLKRVPEQSPNIVAFIAMVKNV